MFASILFIVSSVALPGGGAEKNEVLEAGTHLARLEHGQPVVFDGKTPYVGSKALGSMQFYRYIGRPEIAEEVESRKSLHNGLLIGGAVIFGLSAPVIYGGYALWAAEYFTSAGRNIGLGGLIVMGVGVLMVPAGLVMALVGMVRDDDPYDAADRQGMAAEYNRGLDVSVDSYSDRRSPTDEPLRINLVPGFSEEGRTTLSLSLSF